MRWVGVLSIVLSGCTPTQDTGHTPAQDAGALAATAARTPRPPVQFVRPPHDGGEKPFEFIPNGPPEVPY